MGGLRVDGHQPLDLQYQFLIPLLFCYNKSMGKKLRTRELLTETDHEDQDCTALPIIGRIRPSAIRSKLATQRHTRSSRTRIAASHFRRRFLRGQLGEVLEAGQFECPICLELMVSPVMMACGHAFCFRCLESNAAYSERCCLCRCDQQGHPHVPLPFAQTLIERFLLPNTQELLRYLCRTTQSAEWAKRRRVANFRQGLVVDFQDSGKVWRRAVIVSTSQSGKVEVRMNIKGVESFQRVEVTSRRLAPFTFFTRSRYLEDFPTCLPEHDRTQLELSGLEFRPVQHEEPIFEVTQREQEWQNLEEEVEDEPLRIFRAEMNELDLLLDI